MLVDYGVGEQASDPLEPIDLAPFSEAGVLENFFARNPLGAVATTSITETPLVELVHGIFEDRVAPLHKERD